MRRPSARRLDTIQEKEDKRSYLLLLLLLLLIVCIGVTIWALFFRDTKTVLAPDYAPQQTESNAEKIGDEKDEKLEQPQGGGAVSLTYSRDVNISLSGNTASLLFGNPTKSNQDMVLQLIVQDTVLLQSGLLTPGNQVRTLDLFEDVNQQLSPGGYEGKFVVLYYQPDSGEKAIVTTEIPVNIIVTE